MSFSICIGNAVPEHYVETDGDFVARWSVADQSLENAPEFPNDFMTGKSNRRHPSYSGWAAFCRDTGITDLFYDKDEGLLRNHPGCVKLTEHHYLVVKSALEEHQKISNLPPGFGGWTSGDEDKYDRTLARLLWLEFWMRWALDNCQYPAISNT